MSRSLCTRRTQRTPHRDAPRSLRSGAFRIPHFEAAVPAAARQQTTGTNTATNPRREHYPKTLKAAQAAGIACTRINAIKARAGHGRTSGHPNGWSVGPEREVAARQHSGHLSIQGKEQLHAEHELAVNAWREATKTVTCIASAIWAAKRLRDYRRCRACINARVLADHKTGYAPPLENP